MSTSSPKWSRKSARRASGVLSAALAAAGAALLAACGSGGGDASIGVPPGQGPIAWGAQITIASGAASAPAAAMDTNRVATVFWGQTGLTGAPAGVPAVGAATNTTGDTWSAAELVESLSVQTDASSDALRELSALAPVTGAVALWRRERSAGDSIRSARREAATWATEDVGSAPAGASSLVFAANDAGIQAAAWVESVGGVPQIYVSTRKLSVGTWAPKLALQQNTVVAGSSPTVAIDSDGRVMVLWVEGVAPNGKIRARGTDLDAGAWGNVVFVDSQQLDARNPRVAALSGGEFLAVWEERDVGSSVYSARATTGNRTAWVANSRLIEQNTSAPVADVRLATGPQGTVYAVFTQANGLWLNRYSGTQWDTAATQIGASIGGAAKQPQIAVDRTGNAVVVWVNTPTTGNDDLYYAYRPAGTGQMSEAFRLENEAGAAVSPAVAMSPNGAAVVAWLQSVANQTNPNVVARVFRP
ncbi:MAG: hypothetical protein AB1761_00340 [Pseudomonadota bacterium]